MKYLLLLIASLSLATQFNFKDVRCEDGRVASDVVMYFDSVKGYTILVDGQVVKNLIIISCNGGHCLKQGYYERFGTPDLYIMRKEIN